MNSKNKLNNLSSDMIPSFGFRLFALTSKDVIDHKSTFIFVGYCVFRFGLKA